MTNLQTLAGLSTSGVSDALDRLGIAGQCHRLMPVFAGLSICGPAFTLRYQPIGIHGGTVGDFIDDVPPGAVVAIDNGGRTDCTVWGDILTFVAAKRGVAGTVINGICRDVDRSREMGYPLFTAGHWMRTGKDRVHLVATNEPVDLGGVLVAAGDILLGDDNGVVAVPAERLDEVTTIAAGIEAAEDRIREAVAGGASLREARRQHGYHALQSRPGD
ncbi:MAG: RraA family protein [Sneathiellaceae bacterium]